MAAIKYKVELTEAERSRLNEVSQRGKASVRTVKRALSLLKADQGLRDREIADVLLVNAATVARARKRYVEEGLEAAINAPPEISPTVMDGDTDQPLLWHEFDSQQRINASPEAADDNDDSGTVITPGSH